MMPAPAGPQTGSSLAVGRGREREDLLRQNRALRAELDEIQPLVSAAILTATAFRLRDMDAMVCALRILVGTVDRVREGRAG